ncbi:MAG: M28 family peptidase [Bacteroidales bacterium]
MIRKIFLLGVLLCLSAFVYGQYTPWYYWTFLPEEQINEIIGETSGETAFHTIIETAGYTRNRPEEEYHTTFRESAYIYEQLQSYGIDEADLVRVPARNDETWNGIRGELWETAPGKSKIVSYRDNAFQLTQGSNDADLSAELVWVGKGSQDEVNGSDVEGKIAVGHGNVSYIHRNAIMAGAIGVVAISDSRNYIDPLQVPAGRIGDVRNPDTGETWPAGFAFQMNIREGQYLRNRLMRGETIMARALVETSMEPYEIQNVEATILGENPEETGVILSAHIFEGLVKQGANDNKSGGAAILEVARVLNTLIEEGRIPRPKRSIRFIWAPEFSGTRPWVETNFEDIREAYCNINMDMVGEWLSLNKSTFSLMRTTFGNAHYVNDVVENYFRFIGEGNMEKIHNRQSTYPVAHRIVAPYGADEPFRYSIEPHYGSSDHEVFNNFGVRIPGVMLIAWPDQWYHTSGDVADKADPTQLKRAVVIAAASAYTIANANDEMAVKIAGEIAGNAASRLGHQLQVSMDMISKSNRANLQIRYREADELLQAHLLNELATVESVYELMEDASWGNDYIEDMKTSIEAVGVSHRNALQAQMQTRSRLLDMDPVSPETLTADEEQASMLIPAYTPGTYKGGPNILNESLAALPEEVSEEYPVEGRINRTEIARLVNGEYSIYTIKIMLDAQQEDKNNLQDIMNFFQQMKIAGLVEF